MEFFIGLGSGRGVQVFFGVCVWCGFVLFFNKKETTSHIPQALNNTSFSYNSPLQSYYGPPKAQGLLKSQVGIIFITLETSTAQ